MSDETTGGVVCGQCGSSACYFETCRMNHPTDHDWAVAFECQECGARHEIACYECDR